MKIFDTNNYQFIVEFPDVEDIGQYMPDMPDLSGIDMPDLGSMDMPDFGNMDMPDLSSIDLPDFGSMNMPNMKDFQSHFGGFPKLPSFGNFPRLDSNIFNGMGWDFMGKPRRYS